MTALQQAGLTLPTPDIAINQRPDIRAEEWVLKEAGFNVKVARRNLLPTIPLSFRGGFISTNLDNWLEWDSWFYTLGATVSQQLLTGGEKRANLRAKKAVYEVHINEYRQALLNAYRDMETAITDANDTQTQVQLANQSRQHQAAAVNLNTHRYTAGLTDHRPVLQAEESLLTNDQQRLTTYANQCQAVVALAQAFGGKL